MPATNDGDPRAEEYAEYAEAKRLADEAGLPDSHAYERVAIDIRKDAESETAANRWVAETCEARGKALLAGEVEVSVEVVIKGEAMLRDATTTEIEREAREWLRTAVGARGNIARLIAERSKANRSALSAAAIRDSDAKLDERQRAKHGRRAN